MKTCHSCNETKELEYFAWKNKAKGILASQCKACHSLFSKEHYRRNLEYYKEKNKKAKIRKLEYIRSCRDVPCKDCGNQYPFYMMQFDHRSDKEFNIPQMSSQSWKRLKKEIAKCDVVCANHHAERTYLRNQGLVA